MTIDGSSDKEWFRDWFDETYLALYHHRDDTEAHNFLAWMSRRFGEAARAGVVDLACGAGRHSRIMSREYGWRVTGVDLSASLLRIATAGSLEEGSITGGSPAETDITDGAGPGPCFVRADIRRLPFAAGVFGFAVNLFTSFGYFATDAENLAALREMVRVLGGGGIFLMDHINAVPAVRELVPADEETTGGFRISQRRRYDVTGKRIIKQIELHGPTGEHRRVMESVRIYRLEEIADLFARSGLEILGWAGDYHGSAYIENTSQRMILWARKQV